MKTIDPSPKHRRFRNQQPGLSLDSNGKGRVGPLLCAMACLVLALMLTACASRTSTDAFLLGRMMPGTGVFASTNNLLREGDVIQVAFEGSTNLNSTQRIPIDGEISLQFIGKVKAAGRTVDELEVLLTVLYETQIKPTEITVTMVAPAAVVYVGGAVLRPGKIPLDRPLTVLDAVMESGGLDHTRAKLSDVTLLRIEGAKRRAYHLDLKRFLKGKEGDLIYLRPFDIIYIPERTFNF